ARDQVPAAPGEHGAPDVHAGVDGGLRQGGRRGRDQDLPGHRAAQAAMTVRLGCIADDLTGATDLANNLVRAGMRAVQTIGAPDDASTIDADAVVVALKSRTIEPKLAVAQ